MSSGILHIFTLLSIHNNSIIWRFRESNLSLLFLHILVYGMYVIVCSICSIHCMFSFTMQYSFSLELYLMKLFEAWDRRWHTKENLHLLLHIFGLRFSWTSHFLVIGLQYCMEVGCDSKFLVMIIFSFLLSNNI